MTGPFDSAVDTAASARAFETSVDACTTASDANVTRSVTNAVTDLVSPPPPWSASDQEDEGQSGRVSGDLPSVDVGSVAALASLRLTTSGSDLSHQATFIRHSWHIHRTQNAWSIPRSRR